MIAIYGINQQAQVLHRLIEDEKCGGAVCYVVDKEYKKTDTLHKLPVLTFEEFIQQFSSDQCSICLSFGYKNMVKNREEKFYKCKEAGYEIYSFISKNANVYTASIGEGCIIYPGTTIMPFAEIGKGTFIESGVVIAHHTRIGSFNFIAPGAHFCGAVTTGKNCFIGGAAEIVNSVSLADGVFVGAGAKVSHDIYSASSVLPARSYINEYSAECMMNRMFDNR